MNLGEEEAKGMKGKVELRGWRLRKRSQPVFFPSGGPKDAGQPGKKRRVGGVSGGRRQGPHYACLEGEVRRREEEGRSPASLGIDAW